MKYFWCTVFFCGIMVACQNHSVKNLSASQADSAYTIIGKIQGIDSGWVYLLHRQSENQKVDSAKIDTGFFIFNGKSATPELCMLGLSNNGHKEYRLSVFVQNGQIRISAKKDSLNDAVITGSQTQDEYKKYIAGRKPLDEEMKKLGKLYDSVEAKKDQRLMDSLEKIFEVFGIKEKGFVKDYAKSHATSYVAAFEVYQNFSYNPDAGELDTVYNQLAPEIQLSYYGKRIKNVLDIAKKTAIGNVAPGFTEKDVYGKPVSLSSVKGKYVLVDFWASWCGPCRAENPGVARAYKNYHAKGFNILGVSLDEDKDKWEEAIRKDNLTWTQVSDLKGWKNSVAEMYGIEGIPMNFLLDKDGKIIAKGLRGSDLDKKLEDLLK